MNLQTQIKFFIFLMMLFLTPVMFSAQQKLSNSINQPKKNNMISVRVTYKVKDNYVIQNKQYISDFLKEMKELPQNRFHYSISQLPDGSFVHLSNYADKEIQQQLLNLPKFLKFQEERDKNLESEPKIEILDFVGSSRDLF